MVFKKVTGILEIIIGALIIIVPFLFEGIQTMNDEVVNLVLGLIGIGFILQGAVNLIKSKR
jgi:hypothetical protein